MGVTASRSAANHLKARLASDEVGTGLVVRYSRSSEIVAVAKGAGFDALYIDLEHAPLTLDQTSQICITALASGITPLVRVPEERLDLIPRVLDGGAQGVIVPHIATAADATAVVSAALFAPRGTRSPAGAAVQLNYLPVPVPEAHALLNESTLVAVMVESEAALEAVDEIAAVDGVDMLLVGANDLLSDMNLAGRYDHERLMSAYARVLAAGRRHGTHVGVGGLATRLDLARTLIREGARFVSVGADISFLVRGARAALADLGEIPRPA